MNTNRQSAIKESKTKITTSKLIRWSGLAAMVAGIIFVVVQTIHPPDILSSVTTRMWIIVHYLTFTMCLLGLLGITGIYARQVEKAGWLGLTGFLLFAFFYAITAAEIFVEAIILPLLASEAPKYVTGFLGMIDGIASNVNLGALPLVWQLTGLLYVLGGLLFGIATFRAGILSRWAAALFGLGAVSSLAFGILLPHEFVRLAAVPVGLGLVWLGYSLLSERRAQVSEPLPGLGSPQPAQTGAK